MKTRIITIVGDSLSMVRPQADIDYVDTYEYKLQNYLGSDFHVIQRSKRLNDVNVVAESLEDDVLNNNSKFVILHVGIVDCAPRLFSRNVYLFFNFISRYPILRKIVSTIIKFKSRNRRFWTRICPKTYVSKDVFHERLEFIINQIKERTNSHVIIINIADTNNRNKKRSYNYDKNIKEYNSIIKEIILKNKKNCELIDFYNIIQNWNKDKLLLDDGVHISKEAHDLIARLLCQKINELKKNEAR